MSDKIFPKGIRLFGAESAPDFVIGSMIISLNDFFAFCKAHPELQTDYKGVKQLKLSLLKSKDGKPYAIVDNYSKESKESAKDEKDSLPF